MEPVIAETVLMPTKPVFEKVAIHRIQLQLTTADVSGANNDSGVCVQMNAADDKFFLYRGFDNFERRETDTYDVLSRHISFIRDIQYIKLGVRGTKDNWRIQKLVLLLNDCPYPVFAKDFGVNGLNITNDQPLTISSQELRKAIGWNYNNNNANIYVLPAVLKKDKLISMVEAVIGNQILDTNLAWGDYEGINTRFGPVVEVRYKNFDTLNFDLDLQKQMDGPNPEVDVNFDLVFKCENGRIRIDMKNITYSTSTWAKILEWLKIVVPDILTRALRNPVAGIAASYLSKFLDYSVEFTPDLPPTQQACRLIHVLPSCDVKLR